MPASWLLSPLCLEQSTLLVVRIIGASLYNIWIWKLLLTRDRDNWSNDLFSGKLLLYSTSLRISRWVGRTPTGRTGFSWPTIQWSVTDLVLDLLAPAMIMMMIKIRLIDLSSKFVWSEMFTFTIYTLKLTHWHWNTRRNWLSAHTNYINKVRGERKTKSIQNRGEMRVLEFFFHKSSFSIS